MEYRFLIVYALARLARLVLRLLARRRSKRLPLRGVFLQGVVRNIFLEGVVRKTLSVFKSSYGDGPFVAKPHLSGDTDLLVAARVGDRMGGEGIHA